MPGGTELSRRRFISLAAMAAGLMAEPGMLHAGSEPTPALEDLHSPRLRVPAFTSNGARVPIVVEVPHPMTADHRITGVQIVNPRDPVPVKGTFEFSPANGRAYVAFPARLDEGPSIVTATAECGRHGRFAATAAVTIADGEDIGVRRSAIGFAQVRGQGQSRGPTRLRRDVVGEVGGAQAELAVGQRLGGVVGAPDKDANDGGRSDDEKRRQAHRQAKLKRANARDDHGWPSTRR